MAKLTPKFVNQWRKARGISARVLGVELDYAKSYIKQIEGGSMPLTANFERKFRAFQHKTQTQEYKTRQIESRYPLPRQIKILARPRRCKVCQEWFIFSDPKQDVCTSTHCRREARRRKRIER